MGWRSMAPTATYLSSSGAMAATTARVPTAAAGSAGPVDAVAFGTAFLANPDLPEQLRRGAVLNSPDPSSYYSPGPVGYTDYPSLEAAH